MGNSSISSLWMFRLVGMREILEMRSDLTNVTLDAKSGRSSEHSAHPANGVFSTHCCLDGLLGRIQHERVHGERYGPLLIETNSQTGTQASPEEVRSDPRRAGRRFTDTEPLVKKGRPVKQPS